MSVVFPNVTVAGTVDGQAYAYRRACRVRTTGAVTLASVNSGAVIDGVTLATDDRLLVANQGTAENGIYVVQAAGGLIRAEDYAAGASATSLAVYVTSGTANSNTSWVCATSPGVIGTDTLVYQQVSGTGVDGNVLTTAVQTLTNKTLTAPVISTIVNTGTLTLPTATTTLVGRTTTDTLTNKTLTAPIISTITNGAATLTLPTTTDTIVGRATTDTLSNKTLTAPVISTIVNTGTLTLPTTTDTLVGRATTDTLSNKTLTAPVISTITNGVATITLPTATGTLATLAGTETLTNKTLTAPVISTIVNTGTLTLPTTTTTLVGRNTVDTLTNKTLTAPTISTIDNGGATITLPVITSTLATLAGNETLTNKTLTAPTISTINNGGTITLPVGVSTLATTSGAETFSNKIINTSNCQFVNSTVVNASVLNINYVTTNGTSTLSFTAASGQAHNYVFPALPGAGSDADDVTLVGLSQTLANKTMNTTCTWNGATIDVTYGGTGATTFGNNNVLIGNGAAAVTATKAAPAGDFIGTTDIQTMTNKVLDGLTTTFTDTTVVNGSRIKFTVSGTGKTCQFFCNNPVAQTIDIPALNLDGDSDTLVLIGLAQPLTNKSMGAGCEWGGTTISVPFGGTGATSFTSNFVLAGNGTGPINATKAVPAGAFVGTTDAQTLTNKLLDTGCNWNGNGITVAKGGTGVTSLTDGGVLVAATAGTTVSTSKAAPAGAFVGTTDAQTLTNKTLTLPIISSISNSGTLTLPTGTDTLVGRATVDTLTNKTLTTPTISTILNTGTITLPTVTGTLATLANSETFTNKTLTANTNNVIARGLWYGSGAGSISTYAAGTPTAGQILAATSATTATWQTFTGSSVFGSQFSYIQVASFNTTSTTAQPVTGSTITFNTLGASTYLVQWVWQWSYSQTTTSFTFEPHVNGVTTGNIKTEPSDSANTQRRVGCAANIFSTPGVATITITSNIRSGTAGQTAAIYNLTCWVYRVA